MPFCAQCGANNEVGTKFCSGCGAAQALGSAPVAAAPPSYGNTQAQMSQVRCEVVCAFSRCRLLFPPFFFFYKTIVN